MARSESLTLRNVLVAKRAQAKAKIIEKTIEALKNPDFQSDAIDAAKDVDFYDRVLTLIGSMQLGHNPDKTTEQFDYEIIELITDTEPLTTE